MREEEELKPVQDNSQDQDHNGGEDMDINIEVDIGANEEMEEDKQFENLKTDK